MRVETPLGDYPFQLVRLERRGDGLAVVGRLAGLKSDLILGPTDLLVAGATAGTLVLAGAGLAYLRLRSARR
jgi:hypothetical protein